MYTFPQQTKMGTVILVR